MPTFSSIIDPQFYPHLAIFFSFIGFPLFAWFIVYELTTSSKNRSFVQEIITAISSSVVLGVGLFFLLLWSGIYV